MKEFEGGTKQYLGSFAVLDLHGTWREMGRQYGALAATELQTLYHMGIEEKLLGDQENSMESLKETAEILFARFPARFREMIRGMAETSGLDLSAHLLLNALETIGANPMDHLHCTNIAAWGDYAAGPLVFGRNYDYYPWLKELAGSLIITVLHPSDGSLATATLTWAGGISATTGINERGIFLGMNSGVPSGGALCYDSRTPTSAALLAFLLDSENLEDLEGCFQTTKSSFACIVATADDQAARCYEWPVFEVKRRLSVRRPGLMVATNHFTEFSWGLPRPQDAVFWNTRAKRQNLLNMAEHFKGRIDSNCMCKLLETHFKDLGAMTDDTVWQLVVVPGTLDFFLKVPDQQDWTSIPLGDLLRSQQI